VYDYVDDFVLVGNSRECLEGVVLQFRAVFDTTEPLWNAANVLGLELCRDHDRKIIKVTMTAKILETCERFGVNIQSKRHDIPLPASGYIVHESDYDALPTEQSRFLDKKERLLYLAVVGALLWISGIRHDILFAVLYLTWSTKSPRRHHFLMAEYCLSYLFYSSDLPLVLGGSPEIQMTGYSDASLATAPKGRSVISSIEKLHPNAGAVGAKSTATSLVHTSIFEGELDGTISGMKRLFRTANLLEELGFAMSSIPQLWADNQAMIDFVHGEGVAKGVRHMMLRQWYIRENYDSGRINLKHMPGVKIPADKITKVTVTAEFRDFVVEVMGLKLLD